MATRQTKNNPLSGLAIPFACLLILGYFGFHMFQGNLGVQSRVLIDRDNLKLQFELARLRDERRALEHRVNLLRDGNLEKDMLDQQARHLLNLTRREEVVILYNEN